MNQETGTRPQPVSRLYVPECAFSSCLVPFFELNAAGLRALGPDILHTPVPLDMPLRCVWPAFACSTGGTAWNISVDLCASLNGQEVYRQKLTDSSKTWLSGADVGKKWWGLGSNYVLFPSIESVRFLTGGVDWRFSPIYLNISCDTFYVNVTTNTGDSTYSGRLWVRSERGL